MPRRRPKAVNEYMSRLPTELDRRSSAADARAAMAKGDHRHLPVMDGPRLFGILSSRDLVPSVDDATPLSEVCTCDVLTVAPTDTIVDAARGMLRRKVNSAVVLDGEIVVGIVTSSDVMTALIDAYGG
jgi:acetoin utilization protein AcuB